MTPNQATDSTKPETAERGMLSRSLESVADYLSDKGMSHDAGICHEAAALLAEDGKAGGEVVALRQENELLRTALRFYANGDHYHLDASEEFDTVSGEPRNWLCSGVEDSETMIENGEVARHTLMGHVIGWEDAEEDHAPQPIAGEAPFSAAALQTAYNTRPQQAEFCSCHPKQCQGEGLARCRWAVMGFDPQAAQVAQPLTEDQMVKMAKDAGFNLEPTANYLYTVRGNMAQVINLIQLTEAFHGIGKDQS